MSKATLLGTACLLASTICTAQQLREDAASRTFEFGFEQRVRNENWNNITDYSDAADDEREQVRYRTRVWFKAPVTSWLDVSAGLNQETNQKFGKENHFDEVFFDSAYLDFKKVFVKGLSLRVGRQNLARGEGFILFEGTPGDGSRTIYSNAANLSYSWKQSRLDFIGILDPRRDRILPKVHGQNKVLQDWDQSALGIYYTDNNHSKVGFDAYYFYDKEVNDCLPASNPQFQPDRHVHTAGGRAVELLPAGWSITGEFAGQWGAQHPGTAIRGWGGYGYVKKQFAGRWKPYALGGWWGFSGDDPATKDRIEGWDPLFGRWPKWSELYIYSQVREVGVAYWTNTGMSQAEVGFSPSKRVTARLTHYHMSAFHAFPGNPSVFGTGTGRGENVQARIDFVANQNWRAHALYETQAPGSFYTAGQRGYFLRFEVQYSITGKITGSELRHALGFGSGADHHAAARM